MKIELQVEQQSDRLDRWLSQQLPDLSRSRVQKLIEQGHLILNDQICITKKTPINQGDRLSLTIPPNEPLNLQPEAIPLDILYEDEELIILNKAAGLVVHPSPGHDTGTLVHALLSHCPNLAGIGGVERPGIVHRLDKDTTGAIVVAKTDFAHQHLQAQLKAKTARREYWGIVYGSPKTQEGTINLPIGRHHGELLRGALVQGTRYRERYRQKMAVIPVEKGGREAVTYWKVLERLGNYTLMEYHLETGRTHQIRVHSAQIGHPIVGDPLYSSGHSLGVNLSGQVLHARKLSLEHPKSGEIIEAIAPLPDDFIKLLTILRQRFNA